MFPETVKGWAEDRMKWSREGIWGCRLWISLPAENPTKNTAPKAIAALIVHGLAWKFVISLELPLTATERQQELYACMAALYRDARGAVGGWGVGDSVGTTGM